MKKAIGLAVVCCGASFINDAHMLFKVVNNSQEVITCFIEHAKTQERRWQARLQPEQEISWRYHAHKPTVLVCQKADGHETVYTAAAVQGETLALS